MTNTTTEWLTRLARPDARRFRSDFVRGLRTAPGDRMHAIAAGAFTFLQAAFFWGAVFALATVAGGAHAQSAVAQPEAAEAIQDAAHDLAEEVADANDMPMQATTVVPAGESRKEALFAMSGNLTIDGSVPDAFALTGPLVVNGEVRDNLFGFAESVNVPAGGKVGGDVYAFSGAVDIGGEVDGDVYAWSGDVHLQPGSHVRGNVLVGTGNAKLEGAIDGNLRAFSGNVRIDGPVGGDADLKVGHLELGPKANIAGALHYVAHDEAQRDAAAVVTGAVTHEVPKDPKSEDVVVDLHDKDEDSVAWTVAWKVFSFASAFLIGAFLLWVGGRASLKPTRLMLDMPGQSLGLGFVGAIGIPILAIAAMVLVVTIPASLLVLGAYLPALYVGKLVTALTLGMALVNAVTRAAETSKYLSLAVGLAVLLIASLVPFLGFIATCVAVLIGFGALLLAPFTRLAEPPPQAPPVPAAA